MIAPERSADPHARRIKSIASREKPPASKRGDRPGSANAVKQLNLAIADLSGQETSAEA